MKIGWVVTDALTIGRRYSRISDRTRHRPLGATRMARTFGHSGRVITSRWLTLSLSSRRRLVRLWECLP